MCCVYLVYAGTATRVWSLCLYVLAWVGDKVFCVQKLVDHLWCALVFWRYWVPYLMLVCVQIPCTFGCWFVDSGSSIGSYEYGAPIVAFVLECGLLF